MENTNTWITIYNKAVNSYHGHKPNESLEVGLTCYMRKCLETRFPFGETRLNPIMLPGQ